MGIRKNRLLWLGFVILLASIMVASGTWFALQLQELQRRAPYADPTPQDFEDPSFPLHTNPPPQEFVAVAINEGLPYRWETGVVHVLAWEVIEDDRPWQFTQVLVLKNFNQPTKKGGYRWL